MSADRKTGACVGCSASVNNPSEIFPGEEISPLDGGNRQQPVDRTEPLEVSGASEPEEELTASSIILKDRVMLWNPPKNLLLLNDSDGQLQQGTPSAGVHRLHSSPLEIKCDEGRFLCDHNTLPSIKNPGQESSLCSPNMARQSSLGAALEHPCDLEDLNSVIFSRKALQTTLEPEVSEELSHCRDKPMKGLLVEEAQLSDSNLQRSTPHGLTKGNRLPCIQISDKHTELSVNMYASVVHSDEDADGEACKFVKTSGQMDCPTIQDGDSRNGNDISKMQHIVDVNTISAVHIHDIPEEIIHHVWSYFTLAELCRFVAPVCQWWRELVYNPIYWQTLIVGYLSSEALHMCLQRATLLKNLNLCWRKELLQAEVVKFAEDCPQLRKLDLGFCENLNVKLLRIIADNCKNLEHINLEGCRLMDDECMKLLSRLTKLRSVNLSHCTFVQTEGIELLARNLPCLENLNIDGIAHIADNAVFTLVLHHGDHLVSLELDGADMTDAAIQAVTKCPCLTTLTVSFAELMTDVALVFLQELRMLHVLRMKKGADFSTEGFTSFFGVSTLPNLTFLDLSECVQLQDANIHAVVKCCGKSLKELYLRWCWDITDDGLNAIVDGCPKMRVLDLLGLDKIKGHCLECIPEKMLDLRLLDLQQCNEIIDELIAEVVQALPGLVVYNYYGERFQGTRDGVLII